MKGDCMHTFLKKCFELNSPKTNEPIKKWASKLNRTFTKEEIQMAKKTHEKMLTISSNKGNAN
jgi:hypothetical protein